MIRIRVGIGGAVALVAATVLAAPVAWAQPGVDAGTGDGADPGTPAAVFGVAAEQHAAAAGACAQFAEALNLAARSYDEFAYASAGNGDLVDYSDQNVSRYNVVGRTALREAAASALRASRSPGLPSEVAGPMRSWALHATKLLLVMGLRSGGDSLNAAATDLNTDAQEAQMACARHGGRA